MPGTVWGPRDPATNKKGTVSSSGVATKGLRVPERKGELPKAVLPLNAGAAKEIQVCQPEVGLPQACTLPTNGRKCPQSAPLCLWHMAARRTITTESRRKVTSEIILSWGFCPVFYLHVQSRSPAAKWLLPRLANYRKILGEKKALKILIERIA